MLGLPSAWQGGDMDCHQPSRGERCPGQEHKPQAPVPRHNSPFSGSRRALALQPSPALPPANTIHRCTVLMPRIRAPLQNQSSCLPSLLNTWLLCQLLWSNLPKPAVPLLTRTSSALQRVSGSSSLRNKAGRFPRRGFRLF